MVSVASTKDLISSAEFALMKPSAFLINTSRGPLVNEDALLDALNNEKIGGAGLDVYNIEPLPLDHPIRKAKNVTLTPHMGYVADGLYKVRPLCGRNCPWLLHLLMLGGAGIQVFWEDTVANVAAYLEGNPNKLQLMTPLDYSVSRAGKR